MKIYILAQNPKTEENIDYPLSGTKSGETLNRWLDEVLDENLFYVIKYGNSSNSLDSSKFTSEDEERVSEDIFDYDPKKIIALGAVASKLLTKLGISHFKCEHPSGLNRNLNNEEYVKSMLRQLREYLYDN